MENRNLGLNFGPKNALFQVHVQGDALAATACGLGGGSLVNAGVMLPTTARARRDPRWPKSWEKDWDRYEASASEMLRVQSTPVKFQNAKIMEGVVGEEDYGTDIHNPLKLSMNLEMERSQEIGSCLACGNCLAGCPYNAKNSTDKTYLVSAVQAGCIIRTGCEVQYVVRNEEEKGSMQRSRQRRWLVYINELDYIATDIAVISAGVFGTAKILFQSQLRGLAISDKLGSGLSCNGNNVAYLAGSTAPLNAKGLHKAQVSNIPFQERPGPSISSSYTSSLGFTIQSAVVPTAYPSFLFKGITTYGSQSGYSFLYGLLDMLRYVLGLKCKQEMVLNAIGHDDSSGRLTFEKDTNRIMFQPPRDHLLPRKIEAFQKLAKKLGGVLFMSRYRSTSVHLLGSCVASPDVASGVCNPQGQVFDTTSAAGVHAGLYICDASIIPCSVGINPCLTVAAAAEHVSRHVVQDGVKYVRNFENRISDKSRGAIDDATVTTTETMRGQVGGMPCTAYLKLRFESPRVAVEKNIAAGESHPLLRGKVGGYIECKAIEIDKLYVIKGEVDLCRTDVRTPYTQYMHYHLLLAASSGARYVLEGRKIMNPYLLALYTWRESTTLNVSLRKITNNMVGEYNMNLEGKLHISPVELLKSVCALEGGFRSKFVCLLMQSLFRTYILQTPRGIFFDFTPKELAREPYPESTIHEVRTEDNFTISCQHWICSNKVEQEKKPYPVLLINGYATESYCLPTEKNDLVRTLLKDGHDVWLLHSRMHWSNSSNHFSVEDIGRLDIVGAITKIILYGPHNKVHVVAHCVGGLAIHISIMGGHVPAKNIASLSCTNSSMFFKLTTSSSVKMWLPLLPISMAILGENTILPMLQGSATSYRHRLLKAVARLMPRCERCTCDECEVFSGIFGNAFWHENISQEMHSWMSKENLPRLPMAAFPHLRRICNAGFIVDSSGSNSYMIHPERMALPTLYVSGGRTLLVTPETSFLANKYMKMHQPGYRHERVVVDGFGHSDLLIGEESCENVFPHIQKHIELAEEERSLLRTTPTTDYSYMKEALAWSVDPYEDGGRHGSWIFPLIIILLLVFVFNLLF